MSDAPTCEHPNQRACYRIFSNGVKHYGFQCVRCGHFIPAKKLEWLQKYDESQCGPYEPLIVEQWYKQQRENWIERARQNRIESLNRAKENRETRMKAYYDSEEWDRKRRARMRLNQKLFNGRCEICLDALAEQCHHITYDRFGSEWLFDLACVCPDCHTAQHEHMQEEGDFE